MFMKLQVSIPFCETLEQILMYAKFMKGLITGKRKLKYDENITLNEKCSDIMQRKLPPYLKDSWLFTIQYTIGKLNIGNALCDFGENINLMPLSMMKKLECLELEPTKIIMSLEYRYITYLYEVLEYVLVRAEDLLFPAYFVILDMVEDT